MTSSSASQGSRRLRPAAIPDTSRSRLRHRVLALAVLGADEYSGVVASGGGGGAVRRWRRPRTAGYGGRRGWQLLALAHAGLRQSARAVGPSALSLGRRRRSRGLSGRLCDVPATILDGKATAAAIRAELTDRVAALAAAGHRPGLGTLLVGDDPASRWYVGAKHSDCAQVGIASIQRELPATATQADVLAVVGGAQRRPGLHRLHRPAAAAAAGRRVRRPRGDGPGQGRRRAAPDEPRPPRAERARPAALHAGGHRGAAPALRRPDRRRGGRRRRPGDHRGPAARPAAHPPLGERDRDAVPHRHPRPGRARAAPPTSSSRRPASRG